MSCLILWKLWSFSFTWGIHNVCLSCRFSGAWYCTWDHTSDFPLWRYEFESISSPQHLFFDIVWNLIFSKAVSFCQTFSQDFLKIISMYSDTHTTTPLSLRMEREKKFAMTLPCYIYMLNKIYAVVNIKLFSQLLFNSVLNTWRQ